MYDIKIAPSILSAVLLQLEKQIREYEKEKQATIAIFSFNPEDYSVGKNKRLDELIQLIDTCENEWLQIHEKLEALRKQAP